MSYGITSSRLSADCENLNAGRLLGSHHCQIPARRRGGAATPPRADRPRRCAMALTLLAASQGAIYSSKRHSLHRHGMTSLDGTGKVPQTAITSTYQTRREQNACAAGVDEAAATPEAVVLQNLLNVISRQTLPAAPMKTRPAKPSDPNSTLDTPLHDTGVCRLHRCPLLYLAAACKGCVIVRAER